MSRSIPGALAAAFVSLLAAGAPATAAPEGPGAPALVTLARMACDVSGRCYETGDPGYRDDDAPPPPRRRYDPDDNERPGPPPRRRFDPDDDDRPLPPPRRRYDPDDDDRPPPPPRRRYNPDDDDR